MRAFAASQHSSSTGVRIGALGNRRSRGGQSPVMARCASVCFATERADTRTITYQPLVCSFVGGRNVALLQFRPDPDVPEQRYVELENGCWVSVLQRIVPNPEEPDRVRTAAYSYSYSLGPNPDEEWLVRYDYVPERAQDPEHTYPASHVHVNATNESYDEFMASLGEEFREKRTR